MYVHAHEVDIRRANALHVATPIGCEHCPTDLLLAGVGNSAISSTHAIANGTCISE